ncbi:trichodiene oxygenase [Nannizzia gypsea CBS 118893]|uniref:Trichodiene oxygenase n=1 Tax=Arthroderma gypseum (strain ATCC MYA-4604 / CBS 118893) TaxID=535722 RepID=E4UY20_ARTGP|nr:trichodiene oxygenase [Nannizzia gypsea CBS 118893]EFR02013.1 trichodiene oxygenase [Nannizzia gypsea CBS 118893]
MEMNISWLAFVGAVIAYYGTLIFYRLFLHPLARFPGPKIAAISRWYEAYYDVVLGGQYTAKIAELHKKYGPIIRISPYELHVIDPVFFEKLYRSDGRWDKYSWTYDAFGAKTSTIFGADHYAHKARRRAIAPFFSKSNIVARHDLLHKNIKKLSQRIASLEGATFNLGAAISAFARDNANELIVGKYYNELDVEDFGIGLSLASQGAGVFWRTTKHIRWFGPSMRAMPIEWAKKMADKHTQSFLRYLQQQSEQDTRATLTAATSTSPDDITKGTLIYAIANSDLTPADKTFDRVFEEVATVTGAGFETISNTLRLILYHVYSKDEILQKLRDEINAASTQHHRPLTLQDLEQLPYLTAVLTEGLRLSPGVGSRAARITDQDLFYEHWRIPAGTPVGMTTILMHTDEKLYPDPMTFNPNRWMDATAKRSTTTFAPFSRGTRICLGMHLAWAEMYLLLAALVQRFDFKIKDATAGDFAFSKDNFGIGTKATCNLMVHVGLRKV